MSTNFPTSLDDATSIPVESAGTALSTNHVTNHQNVQDAIEAIEAKVGVDGSAVTTSHDYKLSGVTGSDKAVSITGSEVLTNKTLTSPTINTPKIAVGSDAVGDLHVTSNVDGTQSRLAIGTNGYILKSNGTTAVWGAETTTVDASTTVKGVGELATSAEITAGTATGGTGAPLIVTPDALASSTPVFDGSGLTGITKLLNLVTTDVTYSSSTAENNLLSYSVAGGTLGTGNVIRVTIHVSAFGVTNTNNCVFRFKYGATTIASKTYTPTGANASLVGKIEFILAASGATNSQNGSYVINMGQTNYVGNGNTQLMMFSETAQGTATEDSTAAKTLAVTAQHSNSNALDNITASLITVEVLR